MRVPLGAETKFIFADGNNLYEVPLRVRESSARRARKSLPNQIGDQPGSREDVSRLVLRERDPLSPSINSIANLAGGVFDHESPGGRTNRSLSHPSETVTGRRLATFLSYLAGHAEL